MGMFSPCKNDEVYKILLKGVLNIGFFNGNRFLVKLCWSGYFYIISIICY